MALGSGFILYILCIYIYIIIPEDNFLLYSMTSQDRNE